eukprot:SAG11_NODE_1021_length_6157_cov_1.321063_5_plen_570_part_00
MSEVEHQCDELFAQMLDKSLSGAEKQAACKELDNAVRGVSRTDTMATVAAKLLDLQFSERLFLTPTAEILAYVAIGEVEGYADLAELFSFTFMRWGTHFAPFDGWGSHDHPEWRHRMHDMFYSTLPKIVGISIDLCGDCAETAAVLDRMKSWGQASAAALCTPGDATVQAGAVLSAAVIQVALSRFPAARHEASEAFLSGSGVFQTITLRLQESPVDSADLYLTTVSMGMLGQHCIADAGHTSSLFASGMLEAYVGIVVRARNSEVPAHVSANRGIGQFVAGVASSAEGRDRLLATKGMEEALMWLLEHGGDPVGIAENKTLTDPRGMAGLSVALLRGREEDAQVALPSKVVQQIVSMIDTYATMGPAVLLPYAQGLAELSVSDANKQHLTAIPAVVDSLRRNLGVDSPSADDISERSLRSWSCSTLVQLAASDMTLPLLLGHAVLKDLEQIPSLPESSMEARNHAMAVLFAVQQHEKRAAGADAQALSPERRTDESWIMLSYQWSAQATVVRIRDSFQRRNYRVWMDIDQMRGSVRSHRSTPVATLISIPIAAHGLTLPPAIVSTGTL